MKVFWVGLILFPLGAGPLSGDTVLDLTQAESITFNVAKGQPAIDIIRGGKVQILINAVPKFNYDPTDAHPIAIRCRPGTTIAFVGNGGTFVGDIVAIDDQNRRCPIDKISVNGQYELDGEVYVNSITYENEESNLKGENVHEGKSPPSFIPYDEAHLPLLENLIDDSILRQITGQILEIGSEPYHQQGHGTRLLCQSLGGIHRSRQLGQWRQNSHLAGVILGQRQWIGEGPLSSSLHGGWTSGKSHFSYGEMEAFSMGENHALLAADLRYDGFHGLFQIYGAADYCHRRTNTMAADHGTRDGLGCRSGFLLGYRQIFPLGKSDLSPLILMLKCGGGYQVQRLRLKNTAGENSVLRDGIAFSSRPLDQHFPFCQLLGSLEQFLPFEKGYLSCRLEMALEHRFPDHGTGGREMTLPFPQWHRFLQPNVINGLAALVWRSPKGHSLSLACTGNFSLAMRECWLRGTIFLEF